MTSLIQEVTLDGSELLLPSARPRSIPTKDTTTTSTTPATSSTSIPIQNTISITSSTKTSNKEEKEETGTFKFTPVEASAFPLQKEREHKDLMQKWGLDRCCEYRSFRFDERFTVAKIDAFTHDFFHDANVQATLRTATSRGEMVRGGLQGTTTPPQMSSIATLVPTTKVRMDLFNKIKEEGLANEATGRMRGCMPELFDGVECDTLVREMLLNEDSEHYLLYDDEEKDEFLFRIFRHLIIGGGMCQADELLPPYLETTRQLYKSLVKVRKVARETGPKIEVTSKIIAIQATPKQLPGLFPKDSDYNLCYLIIDAGTRKVTFWSNAWVSFW